MSKRFILYHVQVPLDSLQALLPREQQQRDVLRTWQHAVGDRKESQISYCLISPEPAFATVDLPFWQEAGKILGPSFQMRQLDVLQHIGELGNRVQIVEQGFQTGESANARSQIFVNTESHENSENPESPASQDDPASHENSGNPASHENPESPGSLMTGLLHLLHLILPKVNFSSIYPTHTEISWAQSLMGRRLLLSEITTAYQQTTATATLGNTLQQNKSTHASEASLLCLLQRFYLLGYIEWHSPIGFQQGAYGQLEHAYCRRCGYNEQSKGHTQCHKQRFLHFYHRLKEKLWGTEPQLIPLRCKSCQCTSCIYCPRCLQLGQSKACEPYILWKFPHFSTGQATSVQQAKHAHLSSSKKVLFAWHESLSPAQQQASAQLAQFIRSAGTPRVPAFARFERSHCSAHPVQSTRNVPQPSSNEFLLWAVCGAGKTEILFDSLHDALGLGRKILLTSPRRDVIIELAPRLKEAFPQTNIVVLHGDSPEKYGPGELFLATTHQCLRFYQFFDLVIIDEVDAFPFSYDEMLKFAVHRAKKPDGVLVYLTATPSAALQQRVEKGTLPHAVISTRYHGYPLAVPVIKPIGNWRKWMRSELVSTELAAFLTHLFQQKRFGYLFVPRVQDLELVQSYLSQIMLPYVQEQSGKVSTPFVLETVHAEHPQRSEIVQRFRRHDIHLLLTTTILERGVTIPWCDVGVLGSDDRVFPTSALIQMAGRVGRKIQDPVGSVWFFPENVTNAQLACVQMINKWNKGVGNESDVSTL